MDKKNNKLILLTGPSGAGKTEIYKALIKIPHLKVKKIITCTTREARKGEKNGRDYHFLKKEEFIEKLSKGEFVEHALVYDKYYGSRKVDIENCLKQGFNPLFVIDVQGALTIQKKFYPSISIFVRAETVAELRKRLIERKTDKIENIDHRLKSAPRELEMSKNFTYRIENQKEKIKETILKVQRVINMEINYL